MADKKEHKTKQSPVQEVIQAFGGLRPLAKVLGVAVSTVQGWKERDSIPATRHEEILKAAAEQSLVLDVMLVRACDTAREAKPAPLKTAPLMGKSSIPESGSRSGESSERDTKPTKKDAKETEKKSHPSVESASRLKTKQQQETTQQKQKVTQKSKEGTLPPHKTPRFLGGAFFWAVLGLVIVGGAFVARGYWLPVLQTAVRFGDDDLLRSDDRPQSDDIAQGGFAPDDVERRLRALERVVADQQTLLAQSARDFAALAQEQNRLASAALSVPSQTAGSPIQSAEGADVIRLQAQIDGLRGQFAQSSDIPLYLVLSIFQLRDALRGSAPFVRELDLVRQAGQGYTTLLRTLDPLDAMAAEGLPSVMSLKRDFPAMARAVISADKVKAADGWLARAIGRVTDLVSLRRTDLDDGQSLAARLWRAENLLLEGDLDGTLQELRQLQGPTLRAADDWLVRADQRVQARLLLRQLTSLLGDLMARGGTGQ